MKDIKVIEPTEETELALAKKQDKIHNQKIKTDIHKYSQEDFDFARASIYDSIEKLSLLLDDAIAVATETQAARSIEVATNLGKMIIDSSKELLNQQDSLANVTQKSNNLTEPKQKTGAGSNIKSNQVLIDENPQPAGAPTVNISMTTNDVLNLLRNYDDEKQPIDITPPKD